MTVVMRSSLFARACLMAALVFTAAQAAAPSPASNATTGGMKPAAQSLINSGPGLAFSGIAFMGLGLTAGVDISEFLRHGQFLAFAAQLKGLDVNFTACAGGVTGAQAQATCPTRQEEKVFTRWSSWFNIYGLNFALLPVQKDEQGFSDPFNVDVRLSRAVGTMVCFVGLMLVLTGIQALALKLSETEEEDYDKALDEAYNGGGGNDKEDGVSKHGHKKRKSLNKISNVGRKRLCFKPSYPQVTLPCFPVRYWFNRPYVQLKVWAAFHFSLTCAAFSLLGGYGLQTTCDFDNEINKFKKHCDVLAANSAAAAVGWIMLIIFCVPLPIITYYIVHKYLDPDEDDEEVLVRFDKDDELYKGVGGKGYRDVDTAARGKSHYVKTWRKSELVNKFGAPYFHLKFKRRHYATLRLLLNFVEAGIITGVMPGGRQSIDGHDASRGDLVSIAASSFYLIEFGGILIARPHFNCGHTVFGMLGRFHNILIVMASVLYLTDGIFNTQDILSIETDGVELMLCVAASVGVVFWILWMFMQTTIVWTRAYNQVSSGEAWDKETDNYRRNHIQGKASMGSSAFSALTDRGSSDSSSLPPMLRMLQMKKAPVVADEKPDMGASNPMRSNPMPKKSPTPAVEKKPTPAPEEEAPTPAADTPAAATPGAAELPPGWQAVVDPTSGRTYYINSSTRETKWDMPKANQSEGLPPGWQAVEDPSTKRTYYYNAGTQKTSWTVPTV